MAMQRTDQTVTQIAFVIWPPACPAADRLEQASKARDKVLHGKTAEPKDLRQAVVEVLDYSVDFNDFVQSIAGFRPFGPLRGFKGRAKPLGKSTSRWVLRGVGFKRDLAIGLPSR